MHTSTFIFGSIIGLLTLWALGATYFFAPDLFACLDISDILSAIAMTILAVGGNVLAARPF